MTAGLIFCLRPEHESLRTLPDLPDAADAASTAKWIRRVMDKEIALPKPIANQGRLLPLRERVCRRLQSSQSHCRRRGNRASGRWKLAGKNPHQGKTVRTGLDVYAQVWCVTATGQPGRKRQKSSR